jgi:hypothetical protein
VSLVYGIRIGCLDVLMVCRSGLTGDWEGDVSFVFVCLVVGGARRRIIYGSVT